MQPDPADPRRAAIYFAPDGYEPASRGINGRRVAGESFLRGYLAHMGPGAAIGCCDTPEAARDFRAFAARHAPGREARTVLSFAQDMTGIGTLFYPSPNLGDLAWQRMLRGQAAWAISGITHTTSTKGVMAHVAQMVHAPVAPWDALICTSRAVLSGVETQLDLIEDHARQRFGGGVPPRPMLPVIPLGVHCDDFARDPAAGAALRARLELGAGDILAMTLSRLSFAEKFDPLPVFVALQAAAGRIPGRLHYALVGRMGIDVKEEHYRQAAARLMPGVTLHILDGRNRDERVAALSGSDMFLFPIDNLQETFGLAPVEAMAAGLPVIATDWDGLRDTVTPECGILIPTLTGRAGHSRVESLRYLTGTDSYHAFLSLASAMTAYDPLALADAVAALAADPERRARMGRAGRTRAREVFDWARIIPQMQDLWAEQDARRRAAPDAARRPAQPEVPILPSAFATFRAWPSEQLPPGGALTLRLGGAALPDPAEISRLRGLPRLRRMTESVATITRVLDALTDEPQRADSIARALEMPVIAVERAGLWLLKYGYARRG